MTTQKENNDFEILNNAVSGWRTDVDNKFDAVDVRLTRMETNTQAQFATLASAMQNQSENLFRKIDQISQSARPDLKGIAIVLIASIGLIGGGLSYVSNLALGAQTQRLNSHIESYGVTADNQVENRIKTAVLEERLIHFKAQLDHVDSDGSKVH